ncbi:D-glucuronyl C5-epimerase-like isoform X2 [Mercenaria mercenaria]|nr:D-glucuronyl C5-epimerase-like isoform X2 [Mercenaria mercenaria]
MEIPSSNLQEIECEINREYSVQCRKDNNEVYLPFSFIQKYFEVYGEFENIEGYEKFEFSHSYSEVHHPPDVIRPDGAFMSFEHYNVEIRKRVKCITAVEGVPISTQWEPAGHYYPIQIAQFALSHYSKYLKEGEPDQIPLLNSERDVGMWLKGGNVNIKSVWSKTRRSQVVEFQSSDSLSNAGFYTMMKETSNFAVTFDFKIVSNGSISLTLKNDAVTFHLHYVFSDTLITCDGKNIYYGLGENRRGDWIHFARDADMDLLKGLSLKCSKYRKLGRLTLLGITIRGHGWLDNVTVSSAAHMDHFFNAANWFVTHQDSRGGWPIMVTRKLISGVMELQPGWYSAMAQGHGISTLVRAYLKSKNTVYLRTAINALKIFEISSAQGGVKARFANSYNWYEEYPTTPSSFVLNGFIFSLFGLYDLKEIATGEPLEKVTQLYEEGIKSLKAMLLMYDSGFGTFYDLRHVSAGLAPNRARWDYHTVHISQLLQLSKMEDEPLFTRTVKRWQDYMKGVRSPHN